MSAEKISSELKSEIKELNKYINENETKEGNVLNKIYEYVLNIFNKRKNTSTDLDSMYEKHLKNLSKTLENYVISLDDEKYKRILREPEGRTNINTVSEAKVISNKYAAFIKLDKDVFDKLNYIANKFNEKNDYVYLTAFYKNTDTEKIETFKFYIQGDMNTSFTMDDSNIIKNSKIYDEHTLYLLTDELELKNTPFKEMLENKLENTKNAPSILKIKLGSSELSYNNLSFR